MKLYVSHSTGFDYRNELYEPLKIAFNGLYDMYFPHDEHEAGVNTKDVITHSDAIVAEVSYPSTGQGIELGWAEEYGVPIIAIRRPGKHISSSLEMIGAIIVRYDSHVRLITAVQLELASMKAA